MKVKYQQIYNNECGLCAIKNLLSFNKIKFKQIKLKYNEDGTSLLNMSKELKKYFYEVNVVSFDIHQLKKTKNFTPFIALIKKNDITHYVVIYKKSKRYLYILDSLCKKSYKITYDKFAIYDAKMAIICENQKEISFKLKDFKQIFLIPLLSLLESLLLLSTTILIQQIIDNGFQHALFYILVQMILLLIILIKTKLYIKFYKQLDVNIVIKTMQNIYNLKKEYVNRHSIDEVYYRINDAYSYKSMILSSIFNIVSDVLLLLATLSLMIIYSFSLALILLAVCSIIIVTSLKIFKKTQVIVEQRRIKEFTFLNYYRDSFANKDEIYNTSNSTHLKKSMSNFKDYLYYDYKYEQIKMNKNLILSYFQSFVISLLVLLYFTSLNKFISVGSLIAIINLSTLMLQPILNLCSEVINFSNYKLVKNRLIDLNENVK